MEKQIIINDKKTDFWIEDTGRLRNQRTKRFLKGGINKGYRFYSIYWKGKQYIYYTHRLVAEYFIDNSDNKPIVHHKDGNKLNNFYLNLEWCTTEEHQKTISVNTNKSPKNYVNVANIGECVQFRDSPYYVSRQGDVYNISKKIKLQPEKSGNYYRISCNYNLKGKHFLVHRMVWEAFNGKADGLDIDHIDGNPHNNALDNLRAVSHQENIKSRKMDYSYTVNNFPQRIIEKCSSTNSSESKKGDTNENL